MSVPQRARKLIPEASRFLSVGAMAYVVDVGVFNLLLVGSRLVEDEGKPLTAKVLSTLAATLFSYLGNKRWTYAHRAGRRMSHELPLFLLMNGIAMAIAVGALAISHYGLGFTSALADNIAANVIGVGLGTVFRFYTYRRWVFIR